MNRVLNKLKQDRLLQVVGLMAIIVIVIGKAQWQDIDLHTLLALGSLMLLVSAYEAEGILSALAGWLLQRMRSKRQVVGVILLLAFFGAMIFTNDVMILTLVPLFMMMAKSIQMPIMTPIILLTIFANLGSAVTPFGNPQNLYLATYYHLTLGKFLQLSVPLGGISLILLGVCLMFFDRKAFTLPELIDVRIDYGRLLVLLVSTLIILVAILNVIPIYWALVVSIIDVIMIDRRLLVKFDYGVIGLFISFFIVIGAVSRLAGIVFVLQHLMATENLQFLTSVGLSQVISNVPAAILLAHFTDSPGAIYLGVSIGGLGTLIASLANLLAWRQYQRYIDVPNKKFPIRALWLNSILLVFFVLIGLVILLIN